MRQWSDTKRFRRAIGFALAVAALAAPTAQGGHEDFGPNLALDMIHGVPAAANVSPDSRALDFRTHRNDDVGPLDAWAARVIDDVGPLDPWAVRAIEYGLPAPTSVSPDSRPVDFRTATGLSAPIATSTSAADGETFQWGDAGIGAGAMFVLAVLFAGAGTLVVRRNYGRLASR
jgi:hypothetical protein